MEMKTARLTVLIDPEKKLALEKVCAEQDVTPSQVVRKLIRDYIAQNTVGSPRSHAPRPGNPS
jgi:antitoxin component of RelBE/YafQ-DinJ toxin-antitoxin module